MLLYNTVTGSAAKQESVLIEWEAVAAGTGLSTGCTEGINVNEVHNNPTDNGIKRFLTQGTVFLRNNFFSGLTRWIWILKTKGTAKYYLILVHARNKHLFLTRLRRIT